MTTAMTSQPNRRAPWYPDEEWADIPGNEGRYWISSYGRVYSGHTYKGKRPGFKQARYSGHGYAQVTFSTAGKHWSQEVHRLVARAFIGPPLPGLEVCHNDSDKTNARVDNLRYDTHSANQREAVQLGLMGGHLVTHCIHGHKYTDETSYYKPSRPTHRKCRVCLGQFGEAMKLSMVDPERTSE